jgi:hypothetical protein
MNLVERSHRSGHFSESSLSVPGSLPIYTPGDACRSATSSRSSVRQANFRPLASKSNGFSSTARRRTSHAASARGTRVSAARARPGDDASTARLARWTLSFLRLRHQRSPKTRTCSGRRALERTDAEDFSTFCVELSIIRSAIAMPSRARGGARCMGSSSKWGAAVPATTARRSDHLSLGTASAYREDSQATIKQLHIR